MLQLYKKKSTLQHVTKEHPNIKNYYNLSSHVQIEYIIKRELDLISIQSVSITFNAVSLNPDHSEV